MAKGPDLGQTLVAAKQTITAFRIDLPALPPNASTTAWSVALLF